ncbi:unnamed protein product [Choristocarpus tenellus]
MGDMDPSTSQQGGGRRLMLRLADLNRDPPCEPSEPSEHALRYERRLVGLLVGGKDRLLPPEPITIRAAMEPEEWPLWKGVIDDEVNDLDSRGVWIQVPCPNDGQKVLGTKMVFTRKVDANGEVERYKARLVVQGFRQRKGESNFDLNQLPYEQQWSLRSGLYGKGPLMMKLMIWTAGECGFKFLAPLMVKRYSGQRWFLPGRWMLMEKWKGTRPGWLSRDSGKGRGRTTSSHFHQHHTYFSWHVTSLDCEMNFVLIHSDGKKAFTQADLEETIYVELPEGKAKFDGAVKLLKKTLYGIVQASRNWNFLSVEVLLELDLEQSEADPCLFRMIVDGETVMIMIVHVDDMLMAEKSGAAYAVRIIEGLNEKFPVVNLSEVTKFMGCRIKRNRKTGALVVDESLYIGELVERHGIGTTYELPSITKRVEQEGLVPDDY